MDKTPDVKPVEDGVAEKFRRLQETNIDHFKVDLNGRKSFTVRAPGGCGASSIGCILTGHGSFYVYKAITPEEMAKLPTLCQLKVGSCHCVHTFHILVNSTLSILVCYIIYMYNFCGLCCVQVNNMGGVTITWGKVCGDKAVDDSALKGAWEKAVKVAGWP